MRHRERTRSALLLALILCTPAVVLATADTAPDSGGSPPFTVGTSCSPRLGDPQCNDGNPCTDDSCSSEGVCVHAPDDTAMCDDADACTRDERCADGQCTGGTPIDCTDHNICTDDLCEPTTGCVHTPNAASCDDGDHCTQGDTCVTGSCSGGYPVICTAKSPCHAAGTCDPATGVCLTPPAPDGTTCDDHNVCTSGDMCLGGRCVGGAPRDCDDANICTDDNCDAIAGCVHEPNHSPCDDGSACTSNDTCTKGRCVGGLSFDCDDDNPCTDDACNPATGCTHRPNRLACDDGDACTTDDACHDGRCLGDGIECDDGEPCTDDSCEPGAGCRHTRNAACDDEAAPSPDGCTAGCDDDNVCTNDACNVTTGCVHTPQAGPCDDGNPCTRTDVCIAGSCLGSDPKECPAPAACRNPGRCDPATGECAGTPVPDGATCDDGNECTSVDRCIAGMCVGGPIFDCDDGDPCTDDTCHPSRGCTHMPRGSSCGARDDSRRVAASDSVAADAANPPPRDMVRMASLRPNGDEPSDTPVRERVWKVQLAAVRSTDSATREWERIRRQYDEIVGSLMLSVERADLGPDRGVYYRVRAGAFADKASASAVCKAMTRRNAGCMVVSGN